MAAELAVGRTTVQRWRRRWSASAATASVLERLVDAPRPGLHLYHIDVNRNIMRYALYIMQWLTIVLMALALERLRLIDVSSRSAAYDIFD